MIDIADIMQNAAALFHSLKVDRVDTKSAQDYVTNIDHQIDAFLHGALPGPVISEERPKDWSDLDGPCWIIDPIDGTHNLIAAIPHIAISVAFWNGHEPVSGAIYDLDRGELYQAEKGAGARVNGDALQATSSADIVMISTGAIEAIVPSKSLCARVREHGKLRNLGSQALHLCAVARGQASLALSVEARLWDDAAGALIAKEAGARYKALHNGTAMDWLRAPMGCICAAPGIDDAFEDFRDLKPKGDMTT